MHICQCKDPLSTKALTLLLNNDLLDEYGKLNLFTQTAEDGDKNCAMHCAFANIYSQHILQILSYFNENNKMLMELLSVQNVEGNYPLALAVDQNVLLRVFYYLRNSRLRLMRLLALKNKKGRSVFGILLQSFSQQIEYSAIKPLQYILSDNVSLTDKDKLELFLNCDDEGDIPLMYTDDDICCEMLNHFKNSKEALMELLTFENKEKKTALMFVQRRRNTKWKTLNFILNSHILDDKDKFKLLAHCDVAGKSVLYHTASCCPDIRFYGSYFKELLNDILTIRIIEYLSSLKDGNKKLRCILLQATSGGDTFLMAAVKKRGIFAKILQCLQMVNDNEIISDLLTHKNGKKQTIFNVATQNNDEIQTNLIKIWSDYLRFDKEVFADDKKIDFSFLGENNKSNESKPSVRINATVRCICGRVPHQTNARMLNRMQGTVTCNKCNALKRAQIYHCKNRARFIYCGRSVQHANGGYVLCIDCVNAQRRQKQNEMAQQNAIKNDTEQYTTNPFVECCHFVKLETIQQLLHRIGNNKDILLKLLLSTDKYGNTALHHVSKHRNVDKSCKLLSILLLNNKILSFADKFKIISVKNKTKRNVLYDSNTKCGIELIDYFKKDDAKIFELVTPTEKKDTVTLWHLKDDIRYAIFNHFKNNKGYLQQFLTMQSYDDDNQRLLGSLCASKRNETKSLDFILNCNLFCDKFKLKLLDNVFGSPPATAFDMLCYTESNPEKQMVLQVLEYIKYDRGSMMKCLSRYMFDATTPLMQLCQNSDEWSVEAVGHIFCNPVLSVADKYKLLSHKECRTATTVLQYACNNVNAQFALQIFNYFKQSDNERVLLKLISEQDLLFWANNTRDAGNEIMKEILNIIENNVESEELKYKLLSVTSDCGATFLYGIANIQSVFCVISHEIIEKLLKHKNNKNQTCYDAMKETLIHFNLSRKETFYEKQNNIKSIEDFWDYLQFEKTLDFNSNSYDSNPWITALYLGKENVIKSVLTKQNDLRKLKYLLLETCDENGNNCLLVLAINGHFQIILFILNTFLNKKQFSDFKLDLLSNKNEFCGNTLLLYLCKNHKFNVCSQILDDINDDKVISELLNQTDSDNKSCFHYAPKSLLNRYSN